MNLSADGFFGTNADVLSDLSLILGVFVALTLTVGMILARRKRYEIHRWVQTSAVLLNILQILVVMLGSFNDTATPGIPDRLDEGYYQVASIHALVGLVTVVFGVFVMLRGNNLVPNMLRFSNYKPYMRTAYGLYMLATLLGFSAYYNWYIVAGGPVDIDPNLLVSTAEGELPVPIANFTFLPQDLVVPVGTTLVWSNFDGAPHTVTDDAGLFDSGTLGNSDVFSLTFDEIGEFSYFCEFHGSAGGFGMAATLRVVPADEAPAELIAAVPQDIQLTPQPTPLPFPSAFLGQPPGTASFRDNQARSDQILINIALDEPLPADIGLFAFLITPTDDDILSLGELNVQASGTAGLDFTSPAAENLAGRYNHLLISQEPSGSDPDEPNGPTAFEGILPEEAFGHITELLADGPGLPLTSDDFGGYGMSAAAGSGRRGYVAGIRLQTDEMTRHMQHVTFGHDNDNLDGIQRHAEHIYNIIAGEQDPLFGDLNDDGSVQNPGDGFGLLPNGDQDGYLQASIQAAQAAIDAPDATGAIMAHAEHVRVASENMVGWAEEARDIALELSRNPDEGTVAAQIERLNTLVGWLLLGNDLDGDQIIAPIPGEGGGIVAYEHAQFIAGFGLAAPGQAPTEPILEPAVTAEVVPPAAATEDVVPPAETEEVAPRAATTEESAPQPAATEDVAPQPAETEEVAPGAAETEAP